MAFNNRVFALTWFLSIMLWYSAAHALAMSDSWSDTVSKAELAQARGELDTAEHLLQQAQRLATLPYAKHETACLLGDLYKQQKRYQLAEEEFKWCLKVENIYEYLKGMGIEDEMTSLYEQMGQKSDAVSMRTASNECERHFEPIVRLMTPYMNSLQETIKRQWTPPARKTGRGVNLHLQTICSWLIDRHGRFSLIHVSKSSGDEVLDAAALTAVRKLASGEPFPSGTPEYVSINFSFDYNVFGRKK